MTTEVTNESCPLPYPKRFEAAVDFVTNPHPKAKSIPDDLRFLLFALRKQATEGPCHEPRPWSWNVVETAKWENWHKLGTMTKMDAMRHYVSQLEKNQSDWWTILSMEGTNHDTTLQDNSNEQQQQQQLNEDVRKAEKSKSLFQKLEEATAAGSWSTPYLTGALKPIARYEHGVALLDGQMYIIGGNCTGGKYLNDVWCFDFNSFAWTNLAPNNQDNNLLPPIAGHTLIPWKGSLLVIGGHVKSKDLAEKMPIRVLDLDSLEWTELVTSGVSPVSRGGHTATLLGNKLYIFGGEDVARRPLSDLYVLDLETLVWEKVKVKQTRLPMPRSAHVATTYLDRYILYFGGGSVASCFDDLVVFDTQRRKWHVPTVTGRKPSPRAGHSAAVLRNHWYIVGGGNNSSGCTDMAYLDLNQLNDWPPFLEEEEEEATEDGLQQVPDLDEVEYELSWTIVGMIPERSYLASEGMSLASLNEAGILVAFGGYNGRYSNSVSLFRPAEEAPPPRRLSYGSEISGHLQTDRDNGNETPAAAGSDGGKLEALQAKLDAATKNAAAAKEATVNEMAIMRRQLNSAHNMLQEKETQMTQMKQQLTESETKAFRLEAELAEARHKLGKMEEMEKELEASRRQKQPVPDGKTGGIWGWVAGE
eukprot:g4645.t1